jgi:hypothetical protein
MSSNSDTKQLDLGEAATHHVFNYAGSKTIHNDAHIVLGLSDGNEACWQFNGSSSRMVAELIPRGIIKEVTLRQSFMLISRNIALQTFPKTISLWGLLDVFNWHKLGAALFHTDFNRLSTTEHLYN